MALSLGGKRCNLTNLSVKIGKIKMKNPVVTASGTFNLEYSKFFDLRKLGAIIPKSVTLKPRDGNPPPRIYETAAGMLNAIGLQNNGLKNFLKELSEYQKLNIPIIANISGETIDEYVELAKRLTESKKVHGLEINISCPNVKKGGLQFGTDPDVTFEIISKIRKSTDLAIITKLTPNVTDITQIAKAAERAGSDALSLINTLLGTAIDIKNRKFILANVTGGLSGPAIKPVALRMVWQTHNTVKIPIIGMGGILNANDAIEFILAGATAVAIGTSNFVNPKVCEEIIDGIEKYLIENNIMDINKLIGSIKAS